MAAVNWTDPSEGLVSDPKASLTLRNNKGGALAARSRGMTIFALSPGNTAVAGGNQTGLVPAVGGASVANPAAPSSLNGMGVLGVTDRPLATGVAGVAFGQRSVGVLGQAENASVGVVGRGGIAGVQGTARSGDGVAGRTQSQGSAAGVSGYSAGDGGAGVRGIAVAGPGVEGHSSAGPGVLASSDQAQGVIGEATGVNAAGVFGRNDTSSGIGVDGYSSAGTALRATSTKGTAVEATTSSGTAVRAHKLVGAAPAIDAYSGSSIAVNAESLLETAVVATAVKAGVRATALGGSASAPGAAVEGIILANGDGVKGTAAFNGIGVHGIGLSALGAWAGLFEGDVSVKGILFKYASFFSIDHPLDPERKVLNHASVEAPEYKTFYDGVATLGRGGRARVRLPRWFAALNGDLRYQLTPIGGPGPGLHVRDAAKDSFVIAGGRTGQKVCWQVTGVRRDAWARSHPLRVEQPKRSARPDRPPAATGDLKKLRVSIEKRLGDLRKRDGDVERESRRRPPAPAARPAPASQTEAGPESRAAARVGRSAVRSARSAMKK